MREESLLAISTGVNDLWHRPPRGVKSEQVWQQLVPRGMLSRVLHTLPRGILVLSAQGRVYFYNRTYAQLRCLPLAAFLGHPVAELDRRQRIQELLRTGYLPSEGRVRHERRANHEGIVPMGDGTHLEGAIVIVKQPLTAPFP